MRRRWPERHNTHRVSLGPSCGCVNSSRNSRLSGCEVTFIIYHSLCRLLYWAWPSLTDTEEALIQPGTLWITLSLSYLPGLFCPTPSPTHPRIHVMSVPSCMPASSPSCPSILILFSSLPILINPISSLSLSLPCSQIYCIENAHGQLVRDLDFNPNRQYYLASCGDDCKVKFWDVRNVQEPVKTLEEHSHWLVNCKGVGTRLRTNVCPGEVCCQPFPQQWIWKCMILQYYM